MLEGGHRYAAFCAATGKVGTEYVMQGATFLGPDRRFEDEWALPAKESRGPTPLDEMTQRYGDWFTESLRPAKPEHVA